MFRIISSWRPHIGLQMTSERSKFQSVNFFFIGVKIQVFGAKDFILDHILDLTAFITYLDHFFLFEQKTNKDAFLSVWPCRCHLQWPLTTYDRLKVKVSIVLICMINIIYVPIKDNESDKKSEDIVDDLWEVKIKKKLDA